MTSILCVLAALSQLSNVLQSYWPGAKLTNGHDVPESHRRVVANEATGHGSPAGMPFPICMPKKLEGTVCAPVLRLVPRMTSAASIASFSLKSPLLRALLENISRTLSDARAHFVIRRSTGNNRRACADGHAHRPAKLIAHRAIAGRKLRLLLDRAFPSASRLHINISRALLDVRANTSISGAHQYSATAHADSASEIRIFLPIRSVESGGLSHVGPAALWRNEHVSFSRPRVAVFLRCTNYRNAAGDRNSRTEIVSGLAVRNRQLRGLRHVSPATRRLHKNISSALEEMTSLRRTNFADALIGRASNDGLTINGHGDAHAIIGQTTLGFQLSGLA